MAPAGGITDLQKIAGKLFELDLNIPSKEKTLHPFNIVLYFLKLKQLYIDNSTPSKNNSLG